MAKVVNFNWRGYRFFDTMFLMATDWTKLYKKYKGLWVALEDDEITVIASGKTLREVAEKAKKKGCKVPIVHKVPAEMIPYVGSFSE